MPAIRNHPSLIQPESEDIFLWRYMDFAKFEGMINMGGIFLTIASKLGDLWEGKMPIGEVDWWEKRIREAEVDADDKVKGLKVSRGFYNSFLSEFRKGAYITCWHANQYENSMMWSSYTNEADSIAIRVAYKRLADVLPSYALIGMVNYKDYTEEHFSGTNILNYFMQKDVTYRFENEVRAIVIPLGLQGDDMEDFKSRHFALVEDHEVNFFVPIVDLSKLVELVVLHPDATKEFQLKVERYCNENGLVMPIKSRKSRDLAV